MNRIPLLLASLAFLAACVCFAADSNVQSKHTVTLKKLSDFQTERERYLYVFDLAEAGIFEQKTWPELQPFFDLGFSEHANKIGKNIIVRLIKQIPDRPRLSPDDVGARAYIGWYVVFEVGSGGGIEKFMVSNYHK